jgi:hypothetical protein
MEVRAGRCWRSINKRRKVLSPFNSSASAGARKVNAFDQQGRVALEAGKLRLTIPLQDAEDGRKRRIRKRGGPPQMAGVGELAEG